jgi:hypothetical protein
MTPEELEDLRVRRRRVMEIWLDDTFAIRERATLERARSRELRKQARALCRREDSN